MPEKVMQRCPRCRAMTLHQILSEKGQEVISMQCVECGTIYYAVGRSPPPP